MSDQPLKFGTDGWRAVIADQYTFDNVARVARATVQWLKKTYGASPKVVLGHDTRFQGRAFAEHAAQVMAAEGVHVLFGETFVATPAISWATQAYGCHAGIVITASHNPPEYNGFKIKGSFGGSALPEMIKAVEQEIRPMPAAQEPLPAFSRLREAKQIEVRDLRSAFEDRLRAIIDIDAIRASGITIAHDAMYGAGQGMFARLLGEDHVVALHADENPGFHGQAPEPIERNLEALCKAVVQEGCAAGIANDGDADRIGMVDEKGQFVDSHRMLALLLKYLHTDRGQKGDIVKTFSTSDMLTKMGEAYGLKVHTTPIGFKYIASLMLEGDVLVGGEESGGLAVRGHIPDRDGVYIGLLLLEMMVKRGKKLSALVQELFDEFGPHGYYRVDVHTTAEKKAAILHMLKDEGGLTTLGGHPVETLEDLDGYKHRIAEGWLLIRPSGTEPVLRIYAEAPSTEAARTLVEDAVRQLGV